MPDDPARAKIIHNGGVHEGESVTESPTMEKTMPKSPMMEKTMSQGPFRREMASGEMDRDDMLDYSWSSLGGCVELAGASNAVWLLTLDISKRPSGDWHQSQDLSLLRLRNA